MKRTSLLRVGAVCAGTFMVAALASPATAQNVDSIRVRYRIPALAQSQGPTVVAANVARSAPGSTAASPTAFGAAMGDVFVGASYQNQVRYVGTKPTTVNDGGLVAGFGLGNAREYAGLEVAVSSYSTIREGFGKRGAVSFKLHRILPNQFGIAVGRENALTWGGTDGGRSWYGALSKVQRLRDRPTMFLGSVVLTAGLGNGRFREYDIAASPSQPVVSTSQNNIGYFVSGGVRLHQKASLVADVGGGDLTLGFSLAPFSSFPLVVSPAIADVLGRANGHGRFILGVGYGFHLTRVGHY